MEYEKFEMILNQKIFTDTKSKLIENIAGHPERYVGLFRPTKPKAKLFQNIFHSQESRFGDAFEEIINAYLEENGCTKECSNVSINNKMKNIDLYFNKGDKTFVVEQKIRDDHDSTKKQGQWDDFKVKLEKIIEQKSVDKTCGGIFFVDPSLKKNKTYYEEQIEKMKVAREGLEIFLWYGGVFFDDVIGNNNVWDEILSHLERWRKSIPDFPEVNFDADADDSFENIKEISTLKFSKIFDSDKLQDEILPVLFPENKVLNKLLDHFEKNDNLCHKIQQYIDERNQLVKD